MLLEKRKNSCFLLILVECKTLEFKRDASSPKPILKSLVAFANTAGGRLIIGVDDDKQQGTSRIRNYVVARVFRELHLIEQWGTGVRRIFEEAKELALPGFVSRIGVSERNKILEMGLR